MKDLIHRMKLVIDDAQALIEHLEDGNEMTEQTKCADDGWSHLYNIQIATDLSSKESLTWKKYIK